MEKNKTNKKMLIALSTLCVAFLFVCGAMIGVFAATQQTVNTSFNVSFDVKGNIAATVTVAENVNNTNDSTSFDTTSTTFDALELEAIALSPEKTSVVFTYTFENTGASNFGATLTDTSTAKNIKITYQGVDTQVVEAETTLNNEDIVHVDVATGKTVTVTITVEVNDPNAADLKYISSAANGITWVLDSATYVEPTPEG